MRETTPNWVQWKTFFAARHQRRGARLLPDDPDLSGIPASVACSLAIFQLGESGGGSVVDQARNSRLPSLDEDYADALAGFLAVLVDNRTAMIDLRMPRLQLWRRWRLYSRIAEKGVLLGEPPVAPAGFILTTSARCTR